MRTTTRLISIVATLGLGACGGGQEPEAVEMETTATTSGGAMTTQPQAGAEMQAQSETELAEPEWGEPGMAEQDEWSQEQYGVAGEPYGEQGVQPGTSQEGMPQQGMQMSPEEMRTQIEAALRGAPNLEDDSISVRIEQGAVYLAGLVDSPTEIRIAHDVVHSVPGVENVYTDELRVQ